MSLLKQRPLKVDLSGWAERLSFDLGFNAATDCTWANRMIWIVAEIVSFCFGDRLSYTNWEAARTKTERWNLMRPKSFDPILYIDRDADAKRYFPEIRLGHPWHGKFGFLHSIFIDAGCHISTSSLLIVTTQSLEYNTTTLRSCSSRYTIQLCLESGWDPKNTARAFRMKSFKTPRLCAGLPSQHP